MIQIEAMVHSKSGTSACKQRQNRSLCRKLH